MLDRRRHLGLVCLLFLLSGASALAYQVSWQRVLGIFSGVHIYSIMLIVTAFMAGLGFGSLAGGKLADRLAGPHAVLGFAVCELAIGSFALVSPWLYYDVAYVELGFLAEYPLAMPLVHLALVIFPTLLMGASLPLLSRGMVQGTEGAARTIGLLYGVNALGAGLGAFVTVWHLIGSHGFVTTIRLAALLNFLAAIGALWIWRRLSRATPDHRPVTRARPVTAAGTRTRLGLVGWATVYGLSGFIALSFEILWFRVLDVTIKASPYTFGHLLGLFLTCLGLGSLTGAWLVSRSRSPARVFFWGQWGITLAAAVALLLLVRLPASIWPVAPLHDYWAKPFGLGLFEVIAAFERGDHAVVLQALRMYLLVPLLLLALPTFLMGLTYAYVQRAVQTDMSQVGWRVGAIQTANIMGSILGSLLTGGLFLSLFGTPLTMRLLILLGALYGCLAVSREPRLSRTAGIAGVLATAVLLAAAVPAGDAFWGRFHGTPEERLIVAEDASSVVAMQPTERGRAVLRINGSGHSYLPYGGVHTLLGLVPTLLHPDPREALVIGLGAGETAWGIGLSPAVERIDVYEIATPEYEVISRHFARSGYEAGRRLLADPRVHVWFADGRLALRMNDRRFDLIEADGLEPWMAYSGNLYSREFFELVRDRLRPGGLLCTYVPTERTRRTVVAVFPHVLDFHLEGVAGFMIASRQPIDYRLDRMLERLDAPAARARREASGAPPGLAGYVRHFLERAEVLAITPDDRPRIDTGDLNLDLHPRDEYDRRPVWRAPWPM